MSNSSVPVKLPRITQLPSWPQAKTAKVMQMMTTGLVENTRELVEHQSNALRDLVLYAKPTTPLIATLWIENLNSLDVMLYRWIFPLKALFDEVAQLSNEALRVDLQTTQGEDMEPRLFSSLLEGLKLAIDRILIQIKCLNNIVGRSGAPSDQSRVSRRPTSELTLHAMLLAHVKTNVGDSLVFLRKVKTDVKRQTSMLQKTYPRVPWLSTLPTTDRKSTGHCLALEALWTGKEQFFTGATLPQLRGLEKVTLNTSGGNTIPIKEWLRNTRYQRFDTEEQETLRKLITFQMEAYIWKLEEIGMRTEVLTSIPQDAKQRAGTYLAEAIGRLPQSLLKTYLDEQNHLGLSYNGSTLEPKQKCVMCQGTYIFPEARKEWPAREMWSFGELTNYDGGRGQCGCCAEALVFVQSLKKLEKWKDFVKEVRELP